MDIEWSQQIKEKLNQKIVGNVYGKNVVGKCMKHLMGNHIGWNQMNKSENKLKKGLTLTQICRKIK